MSRPLLLSSLLLLTPAVLLAQGRPSNQDQPGDASTENTGLTPAPPSYAPLPGTQDPSISPRVFRISGGVMAGQVLTRVFPVYTPDLVSKGCGSTTVLSVIIGNDGKVRDAQVTNGPQECKAPVTHAVRQWTYRPYLLNGKPVAVSTTVTMTGNLNAEAAKSRN